MDPQSLQHQLRVAIQNHQLMVTKMKCDPQNGSLKKQLHELQAEIMALSEKQKQAVQQFKKELEIKHQQGTIGRGSSNQVLAHRGLPFLRPANQVKEALANNVISSSTKTSTNSHRPIISLQPPPVVSSAMPVAEPCSNSPNSTVIVVTSLPAPGQARLALCEATPALLNLAPPIRVPQYPHPHTLPASTTTALHNPILATAAGTLHSQNQSPTPASQQSPPRPMSAPVSRLATPSTPCQPLLAPTQNQHRSSGSCRRSSPVTARPRTSLPIDENYMKIKFMAALGLITHDQLTELQSRRSERKRRTTANPQFSYGNWDNADRKRNANNYLSGSYSQALKRPRGPHIAIRRPQRGQNSDNDRVSGLTGRPRINSSCSRPSTPDDLDSNMATINGFSAKLIHNGLSVLEMSDKCSVCEEKGDLVFCEGCCVTLHLACVDPPVMEPVSLPWCCPQCSALKKDPSQWGGPLAIVHRYIAHKAAKEEEKCKLVKKSMELKNEKNVLEQKAKQLTEMLSAHVQKRNELAVRSKNTQESIEKLKAFIKAIQAS